MGRSAYSTAYAYALHRVCLGNVALGRWLEDLQSVGNGHTYDAGLRLVEIAWAGQLERRCRGRGGEHRQGLRW